MGRRARFESLYQQHAGAVLAYALRRTDPHTAEEVVSDVFLVAWRRLDDVPTDALPWLFGTARRAVANKRRGDARQVAVQERLRASEVTATDDDRGSSHVLEALRDLSPRDQEVLLLVVWEDLTPAQASRALGIGQRALAMRLHRAKRRLATALSNREQTSRSMTEGAVR